MHTQRCELEINGVNQLRGLTQRIHHLHTINSDRAVWRLKTPRKFRATACPRKKKDQTADFEPARLLDMLAEARYYPY